ncbi:MAG: RNA polymerase sigma factor [bacterium]
MAEPKHGAVEKKEFLAVVDQHIDDVYHFAYRVSNATDQAENLTREVFLRAYVGRAKLPKEKHVAAWLLKIGVHVASAKLEGASRVTFDYLDDTIRGDPTQITRTGVLTDPEKSLLLWELKQGCMTAVLNCLSLGERMAFVVVVVMGVKPAEAAASLGVSSAALKVRLSRAKKKIVDYLAPRCEHVHPMNPCRCPSRLGVALRKGFIKDVVPGSEVQLRRKQHASLKPAAPLRDVVAIYQQLPPPGTAVGLRQQLKDELLGGVWDEL